MRSSVNSALNKSKRLVKMSLSCVLVHYTISYENRNWKTAKNVINFAKSKAVCQHLRFSQVKGDWQPVFEILD
jgi:hypothetical protein